MAVQREGNGAATVPEATGGSDDEDDWETGARHLHFHKAFL